MNDAAAELRRPSDEFMRRLAAHHRFVDPDRYPTASGEERGAQLFVTRLDLSRTDFDAIELAGVWWIECTMDGSSFISARLGRSRTNSSSWRGCNFQRAAFFKTEFEDCNVAGSSFQNTEMLRMSMSKCDARESDLSGAEIQGVNLLDCDLRGLSIRNTAINRLSLHGSCVADIDLTGCSGTVTLPYGESRPYINVATPEHPDWLDGEAALHWLRSRGASNLDFYRPT